MDREDIIVTVMIIIIILIFAISFYDERKSNSCKKSDITIYDNFYIK